MYLYCNVIATYDEFRPLNRNKKTKRLVLHCFSYLYITIPLLVIFHNQSFTMNTTCAVLAAKNLLNYSSNLMNSSNQKRETSTVVKNIQRKIQSFEISDKSVAINILTFPYSI